MSGPTFMWRLLALALVLGFSLVGPSLVGPSVAEPSVAEPCATPTPTVTPPPTPTPTPTDTPTFGDGDGGDVFLDISPDISPSPSDTPELPPSVDPPTEPLPECTPTPTPEPKKHHKKKKKKKHSNNNNNNNGGGTTQTPVIVTPTTPTPTPTPTETPAEIVPTAPPTEPPPTNVSSTTPPTGSRWSPIIALMIVGAVISSLGRAGGIAAKGNHVALVADRDDSSDARHAATRDAVGIGDRSITWRFPGHPITDAASVAVPTSLARFSPLLSRLTEDGSEFRAIFGLLWIATPLAGLAFGVIAAQSAGLRALPPTLALVMAGAVLAAFDALAGTIAAVTFTIAAIVSGAVSDAQPPNGTHSILVLLVLGFLWMAIPLIGSAIRPLRRVGDRSLRHTWDRFADIAIAALLCGWVAQKLAQAMDLFAGQKTGIPAHANTIALVVMAAIASRIVVEHLSLAWYPRRLRAVEAAEDHPEPSWAFRIGGAAARTSVFAFMGYAFIGACWQWWVACAIFLATQVLGQVRDRFTRIRFIHAVLPRGVVEIFVLVATCTLLARYAMSQAPDELAGVKLAFVLIAIPPLLLSTAGLFTDDETTKTSWRGEIVGVGILLVTVVLALHGWDY